MSATRLSTIVIAIVCTYLLLHPTASGEAGRSGFSLLKLGVSGEGIALADAMSAAAHGASATVYNPAGLIQGLPGTTSAELMFTHREWVQDTRIEYLGADVQLDDENALGVALQSATVGNIEIRTRPGTPEGTFTARTFVLGISYARALDQNLRIGATVKMLYQKLLVDDGTGFGVDLGVQYDTDIDGLSLGAAVANIGTGGTLRTEKTTLPTFARMGGAYRLAPAEHLEAAVMVDFFSVFPDKQSFFNVGGEISFQELVTLRGGYQFGSEGRGFMAGLGVAYGIVSLDYAYAPLSMDLGKTHTVTISVGL
jgi:hypothetical protein